MDAIGVVGSEYSFGRHRKDGEESPKRAMSSPAGGDRKLLALPAYSDGGKDAQETARGAAGRSARDRAQGRQAVATRGTGTWSTRARTHGRPRLQSHGNCRVHLGHRPGCLKGEGDDMGVFLTAPICSRFRAASRPSPQGGKPALTPPEIWRSGRYEKNGSTKNTVSERNRVSRRPAYEKEKPRRGYAVWETKTRASRVRQLPTDQLSCGLKPANIRVINRRRCRPSAPCSFH